MSKIKLFFEYVYMSIYKVAGSGTGRYILMMAMGFIFFTTMLLSVLFNGLIIKVFLLYVSLPLWGIGFIYFLFSMDNKIVEKYKDIDFSYGRSYLIFFAVAIVAFLPLLIVGLIKYFQSL